MNAILFLLSLALGHTLAYNARPIIGELATKVMSAVLSMRTNICHVYHQASSARNAVDLTPAVVPTLQPRMSSTWSRLVPELCLFCIL